MSRVLDSLTLNSSTHFRLFRSTKMLDRDSWVWHIESANNYCCSYRKKNNRRKVFLGFGLEHRTHKPGVGGSNPPLATRFSQTGIKLFE